MFIEQITNREFHTLDVVTKRNDQQALPIFSEETKNVFKAHGAQREVPKCTFLHRYVSFISKESIDRTIETAKNGKKHQIISMILLAATVAVAVAALATIGVLCPVFTIIAAPLIPVPAFNLPI